MSERLGTSYTEYAAGSIFERSADSRSGTVFFLSDFGLRDEFVGVVHAVIQQIAPLTTVIDITHGVSPFDVRGGSFALERAAPYLGPGVVLGVVDPGVGSERRGIALELEESTGPRFFVGPDNGLLVAAARICGLVAKVAVITGSPTTPFGAPIPSDLFVTSETSLDLTALGALSPLTFHARDLFAPVAASLTLGARLEDLGELVDPRSLTTLAPGVVDKGTLRDGRRYLRTEVTWIDRFGNAQLAAGSDDISRDADVVPSVELVAESSETTSLPVTLVRARVFSDLAAGELGVLVDSNGHLAIVCREASAAEKLSLSQGQLVTLAY